MFLIESDWKSRPPPIITVPKADIRSSEDKYGTDVQPSMDGTWLISTDEGGARTVSSWSEIEATIEEVMSGDREFAVIERKKDSDTLFFQVSLWTKGVALGRSFVAEARFPEGNGFRQFMTRTKKQEDILSSAEAFVDGIRDFAGRWTDVTDDYLERSAS